MWTLKTKENNEAYLTYDRERRFSPSLRGIWELIGPQSNVYTTHCVVVNQQQGLLCVPDDEGHVRVLVLE
jgi:hypothetical protein